MSRKRIAPARTARARPASLPSSPELAAAPLASVSPLGHAAPTARKPPPRTRLATPSRCRGTGPCPAACGGAPGRLRRPGRRASGRSRLEWGRAR
eukprot:scaffold11654_cov65-Isochrysis_galbana.AAC.1